MRFLAARRRIGEHSSQVAAAGFQNAARDRMPLAPHEFEEITEALQSWRQGDFILGSDLAFVHVARLSKPLTEGAALLADELPEVEGDSDFGTVTTEAPGFILLSQTCDIVRNCEDRPFVELAALVKVSEQEVEHIRRLKRPSFAYVPGATELQLVADLERTLTIEKAVLATLQRMPGLTTLQEATDFAEALSRKRSRFAFPNDFVRAIKKLHKRLDDRAGKQSEEGKHVDAIREIRVSAHPTWEADEVQLVFWFIKEHNPQPQNWHQFLSEWEGLIDKSGRFKTDEPFYIVDIDDITAKDYLESQRLDYDQLSAA
jgi:hypothetical protein